MANSVRYGDIVGLRNTEGGAYFLVDTSQSDPLGYASAAVNPLTDERAQWQILSATGKTNGAPVAAGDTVWLVQVSSGQRLQAALNPPNYSSVQDAVHYDGFPHTLPPAYPGVWCDGWQIAPISGFDVTYDATYTITMNFVGGPESSYPGQLSTFIDNRPGQPYPYSTFAVNHAQYAQYPNHSTQVYSLWGFVPVRSIAPAPTPTPAPAPAPSPNPSPIVLPPNTLFGVTVLLNSSANQAVAVYTGSERRLVFSLRGQGTDNDNRGTVVLTSGTDGKVSVEVSVDGKECASVLQQLSVPNSENSQVVIVAACNGTDADNLYNDAYVVLTCGQPT